MGAASKTLRGKPRIFSWVLGGANTIGTVISAPKPSARALNSMFSAAV
jgi:hypothetical protein